MAQVPPAPADPSAPRRAGRPRSAARDAAILEAALRLLAREGYVRMTVDQVAAEAGVSKATVYLRWPTKADLATAAVAGLREGGRTPPTGDLRTDLAAVLRDMRRNVERIGGLGLVGTCLAEERSTPELLGLFRERSVAPRREEIRALLRAAARDGRLRPGADPDAAADALLGAHLGRHLAGGPVPEGWEEAVVDTVLGPASAGDAGG
jgi:AcrR family transcriptional regulator